MLRSLKDGEMKGRFGWAIIDIGALRVSNEVKQRYSSGHKTLLGTDFFWAQGKRADGDSLHAGRGIFG